MEAQDVTLEFLSSQLASRITYECETLLPCYLSLLQLPTPLGLSLLFLVIIRFENKCFLSSQLIMHDQVWFLLSMFHSEESFVCGY